jgi:hypothetical protein
MGDFEAPEADTLSAPAYAAFDDHPNEKLFSDRIEPVTVDSVCAVMPRAGLTSQPVSTLR